MSDALKPCPFCGGEAKVGMRSGRSGCLSYVNVCTVTAKHTPACPIKNHNPCDEVGYASEAEAIAAWNTRHD